MQQQSVRKSELLLDIERKKHNFLKSDLDCEEKKASLFHSMSVKSSFIASGKKKALEQSQKAVKSEKKKFERQFFAVHDTSMSLGGDGLEYNHCLDDSSDIGIEDIALLEDKVNDADDCINIDTLSKKAGKKLASVEV